MSGLAIFQAGSWHSFAWPRNCLTTVGWEAAQRCAFSPRIARPKPYSDAAMPGFLVYPQKMYCFYRFVQACLSLQSHHDLSPLLNMKALNTECLLLNLCL